MRCFLIIMAGLLAGKQGFSQAPTIPIERVEEELAKPIAIIRKTARDPVLGRVVSVNENEIAIAAKAGVGEVTYTYRRDDISRLILPGDGVKKHVDALLAEGRYAEAVPILERLYAARSQYFSYLPPDEPEYYASLVKAHLETGDPNSAVAFTQRLLTVIDDPDVERELSDRTMLAYYQMDVPLEARRRAAEWVKAADPYGDSALGWWLVSQLDFNAGEHEKALWTSLQPIVFSSQLPTEYLGHCYAVAIAASAEIEDIEQRDALVAEMRTRGFDWPDVPALQPYSKLLTPAEPEGVSEITTPDAPETSPEEPAKPKPEKPKGEYDDAIEQLRKTL